MSTKNKSTKASLRSKTKQLIWRLGTGSVQMQVDERNER